MHVFSDRSSATVRRHSECVFSHARFLRLIQWDIQNEHIAGHYYEEKLQDRNVTKDMFTRARKLNDSAKLYLNEFRCITSGAQTEVKFDTCV